MEQLRFKYLRRMTFGLQQRHIYGVHYFGVPHADDGATAPGQQLQYPHTCSSYIRFNLEMNWNIGDRIRICKVATGRYEHVLYQ